MNTRSHSRSLSPEFHPFTMNQDLVPLPVYQQADTLIMDFAGLLKTSLKMNVDPSGGCGGMTWPAGELLTRHLLRDHREELRSGRILEIGAGGGLVGLALSLSLGDERTEETPIYITDQQEMTGLMRGNIELNGQQGRTVAQVLNWGEPLPSSIVSLSPTIILAADCVYYEPTFPLLLRTLSDLFALTPSAVIYFAYQKRRHADLQFMSKATRMFRVQQVQMNLEELESLGQGKRFLYEFRAKE